MKASQLYRDEYYAWVAKPPKGRLPHNGVKVRLRATEVRRNSFDTNARTFALITVVDTGIEKTVRARELIDFWDNYEREMESINREKAEREAKILRQKTRGIMIQATISQHFMLETGIDVHGKLEINTYSKTVSVPLQVILDWLNITEDEIERKVDEYLEGQEAKV